MISLWVVLNLTGFKLNKSNIAWWKGFWNKKIYDNFPCPVKYIELPRSCGSLIWYLFKFPVVSDWQNISSVGLL